MKIRELTENITPAELSQVEKFANTLWHKLGVDVKFSHHFIDRINDLRNEKPISAAELIRIFKKEYERNGRLISNLHNVEAVMQDIITSVNLPFAMHDTENGSELIVKTVIRKDNFTTQNSIYSIKESS
jgi:hypothetical protein